MRRKEHLADPMRRPVYDRSLSAHYLRLDREEAQAKLLEGLHNCANEHVRRTESTFLDTAARDILQNGIGTSWHDYPRV
jgi:hypothetical protein